MDCRVFNKQVSRGVVNMLFAARAVICTGSPPPHPPEVCPFSPFSILCIRLIAAVTKRTATYLSLLMTGLYFLSLREHKMVMIAALL